MELPIGTTVHQYAVESLLNQGGAAKVYAARHMTLGTLHALKLVHHIRGSLGTSLVREGRIQARLDPDYVVPVTDAFLYDGHPTLVMPLVEGCTLSELLSRYRPSTSETAAIVTSIARGVAGAHARKLVHRDLKPSNVLLDVSRGIVRVRVADFGLARWLGEGRGDSPAMFRGTPSYAAPEQFLDTDGVDTRADLWSLGVILYRLLAFTLPFGAGEPQQVYRRIVGQTYDESLVPVAWQNLVAGLLTLDVGARGPSADGIVSAISELEAPVSLAAGSALGAAVSSIFERQQQEIGSTERDLWTPSNDMWSAGSGDGAQATWMMATERTINQRPSPLRTLLSESIPSHVPRARDRFVGRERERARLRDALQGDSRLVTLLGPGGVGKTRLALEYAHDHEALWTGGIVFCDLSEARDAGAVTVAMGLALQVTLGDEDAQREVGEALAKRGSCLMILDNFEQLNHVARQLISRWSEMAPEASFLVTSQLLLTLPGETVVLLDVLSPKDSVELFCTRSRARNPEFAPTEEEQEAIEELVALLDHLPLAIELAAARSRVLSPVQLLERVHDRFRLLSGAGGERPARQATLRSTLDWSWELLSDWEQVTLSTLSTFEGGFDLEAVTAVLDLDDFDDAPWALDALQALVEKSLLCADGNGRFTMLHSVHAYVQEKLDAGDLRQEVEVRHGKYFARYGSEDAREMRRGRHATRHLEELRKERENIEVACQRALSRSDWSAAAHSLLAIFDARIHRMPVGIILELAENLIEQDFEAGLRGRTLLAVGMVARRVGRAEYAEQCYQRALEIALREGDVGLEGSALNCLGCHRLIFSDMRAARPLLEKAAQLMQQVGDVREEAVTRCNLAVILRRLGEPDTAELQLQQVIQRWDASGDPGLPPLIQTSLLSTLIEQGKLDEAWSLAGRLLEGDLRILGYDNRYTVTRLRGDICIERGNFEEARVHLEEAYAQGERSGSGESRALALARLAVCHLEMEELREAQECLSRALPLLSELRPHYSGPAMALLALVQQKAGATESALRSSEAALELLRKLDWPAAVVLGLVRLARVACLQGVRAKALELRAEADALRAECGFLSAKVLREAERLERELAA